MSSYEKVNEMVPNLTNAWKQEYTPMSRTGHEELTHIAYTTVIQNITP